MKEIIQEYIDKLKARVESHGDDKIKDSLYGGRTLTEEIKLAQERLER